MAGRDRKAAFLRIAPWARSGKPAVLLAGIALSLMVVLAGGGCDSDTASTTSQTPVTTAVASTTSLAATTSTAPADTTTVSAAAPAPGLTLEHVRNATCSVEFEGELLIFTLVEGSYQVGQGGGQGQNAGPGRGASPQADRLQVIMLDPVDFDDLNDDGADDAAIALRISRGWDKDKDDDPGPGNKGASYYVVALMSEAGEPVQGGYYLVGVGARIDGLLIEDGEILLDATMPPQEGSASGPRTPVRATLELPAEGAGALLLTRQSSTTPAGDAREITITSPQSGTNAGYPLVIKGSVTIAPFENNLEYHVYDSGMAVRAAGPVTVEAPDMGAPGTFTLELSGPAPTGSVFITISDISAADGSVLAMASIWLLIP